jgi:hypothetical protein
MPFQGHNCPGPDFWSENALFAIFSQNFLLKTAFLPFSAIFNTHHLIFALLMGKKFG